MRPPPLSINPTTHKAAKSPLLASPLARGADVGAKAMAVAVAEAEADVAAHPTGVLLIRGLPSCVFDDEEAGARFKERLAEFGPLEACDWLPSFAAARARFVLLLPFLSFLPLLPSSPSSVCWPFSSHGCYSFVLFFPWCCWLPWWWCALVAGAIRVCVVGYMY